MLFCIFIYIQYYIDIEHILGVRGDYMCFYIVTIPSFRTEPDYLWTNKDNNWTNNYHTTRRTFGTIEHKCILIGKHASPINPHNHHLHPNNTRYNILLWEGEDLLSPPSY